MTDLLEVALRVVSALEACGVRYTVGGSLASSFSGEPRSSIDADILVDLGNQHVERLVAALGRDFYADGDALERAVREKRSTNLIHRPTGIKVDLFVPASVLDERQLERRRRLQVASDPDRFMYVHTPEDILLQKLQWFRSGGETSERQWRDGIGLVFRAPRSAWRLPHEVWLRAPRRQEPSPAPGAHGSSEDQPNSPITAAVFYPPNAYSASTVRT